MKQKIAEVKSLLKMLEQCVSGLEQSEQSKDLPLLGMRLTISNISERVASLESNFGEGNLTPKKIEKVRSEKSIFESPQYGKSISERVKKVPINFEAQAGMTRELQGVDDEPVYKKGIVNS